MSVFLQMPDGEDHTVSSRLVMSWCVPYSSKNKNVQCCTM